MSKIDDGGPAFPHYDAWDGSVRGMSLRAYFMGQFLAGSATENVALNLKPHPTEAEIRAERRRYWEGVAHCAAIAADAMIAELSKGDSDETAE